MSIKTFFPLVMAIMVVCTGACRRSMPDTETADSTAVDDDAMTIMKIRKTSRLFTASYQVHKIITHSDVKHLKTTVLGKEYDTTLPLGDRKVAIPIDVTLQAYIDFSNFHSSQIERSPDGRYLHITLPDPKVIVASSRVDHESTKQFTDLLRSDYSDAELADFTQQAVRSILKQVPELGILNTARDNAAAILIPMFAALGYDEQDIVVTFRKDFTAKDLPFYYDENATTPNTPES